MTGFEENLSSSVAWINSAHTWLDVEPQAEKSTYATFVSETGVMEFFVFASTATGTSASGKPLNHIKKVQYDLATVTGFAPLPLRQYLGFHFNKYDWVSSERMIERNANFTHYNIPVDVFWMDIQWADVDCETI